MLQDFVIDTFLAQESLAHKEVSKARFDCTWFKANEEFRTRHGRRIIVTSIFPSYLFVSFDINHDNWRMLLQLRGIKQILGSTPEKPKALPASALDDIRRRIAALENPGVEPKELEQIKPIDIIKPGDTVLINMGLQRPIIGICKLSKKDAFRVITEYMGGVREGEFASSRVTLAPNQINQTTALS